MYRSGDQKNNNAAIKPLGSALKNIQFLWATAEQYVIYMVKYPTGKMTLHHMVITAHVVQWGPGEGVSRLNLTLIHTFMNYGGVSMVWVR